MNINILTREQSQYRLGMILAFGALLWNGTYNALAKGLTPYLSPVSLLILSESLTAAFIIVTFGIVPLLHELKKMDARSIRMAAIVGLLNSAIAPLFFFIGLAKTSAINASVLSSADIICVLIAGKFFLHEHVSRMQLIGGGIVLGGIVFINFAANDASFSAHIGDLYIVIGAFISGFGSTLYKKYLSHVMPELAILIRNIAGVAAVSVLGVFIQVSFASEVAAFPLSQVLLLLAFTFFSRYLNLTFFYESLDRIPVTTLSLIQVGTPVAGIFFAATILGEQVHAYQLIGATFIIFGLMLEQMSGQSLSVLRSHTALFHIPFRRPKTINGNIAILPKNV